jgi:hypothetical protein
MPDDELERLRSLLQYAHRAEPAPKLKQMLDRIANRFRLMLYAKEQAKKKAA